MGPDFKAFWKEVFDRLTSKDDSFLEKRKKIKLDKLVAMRHEQPDNAILRRRGVDIPARLRGMVVFSDLRLNLHSEDLDLELEARQIVPHKAKITFTEKKRLLLQDERQRWMESNPDEDIKNFNTKAFKILSDEAMFRAIDDFEQ